MKYYLIVLLLGLFFARPHAQALGNDNKPWEWEDVSLASKGDTAAYLPNSVVASEKLISLYRHRIAVNSISRCPFKISCSQYTSIAIKRYGFLKGVCLFIDRNFYRENVGIMYYYPFVEDTNGLLKLDDSHFLFLNAAGDMP
jgi:hypothetical protein